MVIAISAARNANPIGQGRPLARIATRLSGVAISAVFYLIVYLVPFSPAKRYFLGHPVAVAATILFWIAAVSLFAKWLSIRRERRLCEQISDSVLAPTLPTDAAHPHHDVRSICQSWSDSLTQLPAAARSSRLVRRLEELLQRQVRRGNARQLADDLREVAGRDSDDAHDSLQLVRIIVWAIPMLGFLGTVIGITQTLGGLDFSDGTAAVDRLKSGLYVAFDTTAVGLVLSVLAIFFQFPIERSEQRLLAAIDARVGHLVSATLPSDEASDNQTVLIAELCRGVQAAVAESLSNQAVLWRDTIEAAQQQWQDVHQQNNNTIADAFELTLTPALLGHANTIAQSSSSVGDRLVAGIEQTLKPALDNHVAAMNESSRIAADRLHEHVQQWQQTLESTCETLAQQQQTLSGHYEAIQATQAQMNQLSETQAATQQALATAGGDRMADAMRTLARAVEILSLRVINQEAGPEQPAADTAASEISSAARRAA